MISRCMNKTPEKLRSGTVGGFFFSVLKIEKKNKNVTVAFHFTTPRHQHET